MRPFIKMHGLRNHFVILDQRKVSRALSPEDVIRICDVHIGVGAEQVLTLELSSADAMAHGAHAATRIFNIDGRESEACGNAMRCVAHLLFDEFGRDEILLETIGGLLRCQKAIGGEVSVTLGPIRTDWAAIPLSHDVDTLRVPIESGLLRDGMALNIGNPHVVFFVDDFGAVDIPAAAPAIQNDPLFPEGVNVGVAEVVDGHTLKLAVWERPGMLTEACGTGACVAAYAGRRRGLLTEDDVTVHLPAGTLQIRLIANGCAVMTGPVAVCCIGYV